MGIIVEKCCKHCGGRLVEYVVYPEGDTETKCLQCGRLDNPVVPDYVLREISKKRYIQGRHRKRNI